LYALLKFFLKTQIYTNANRGRRQRTKILQQKLLFNDQLKENKTFVSDTVIEKSVLLIKLTPNFLANNGKGADVYVMMPYNMPCIVPDSTFHSSMPVTGLKRNTKGGLR
jgi:hypothetical protein